MEQETSVLMNPNSQRPLVVVGLDPSRFQGGIALFSGHLVDSLARHRRTEFFSWSRPYPALRKKPPGEGGSNNSRAELDLFSRKSWEKVAREISDCEPSAVFFNWVHPLQAFPFHFLLNSLEKFPRRVICHNVLPHEAFPFARSLTHFALKKTSQLIVHSSESQTVAGTIFPDTKILPLFLPPLGPFWGKSSSVGPSGNFRPDPNSVPKANRERTLLCFGHIRPYKGIEILIEAFALLRKEFPESRLRIVGKPLSGSLFPGSSQRYVNKLRGIIRNAGLDDRVHLDLGYCSDEALSNLLSHSELGVFPFLHVSASASIMTALSAGLPVVASRLSGLSDCVREGENGFLARAGDAEDLARALTLALQARFSPEKVKASVASFSWTRYAEILVRDC